MRGEFRSRFERDRTAPAGCPSPGPSPFVPHGEGRIRWRGGWITLRPRAPPPARLGSPPPQNCWGRLVDRRDWRAANGIELRPTGPLPGPSPARSSRRGENSMARRMDHAASASAPSGSLRLATSPKTAGEVGGSERLGRGERNRAAPDRAPPPAPPRSFLTERGEFDGASTGVQAHQTGHLNSATWQAPAVPRGRQSAKAAFVWSLQRIHSPLPAGGHLDRFGFFLPVTSTPSPSLRIDPHPPLASSRRAG